MNDLNFEIERATTGLSICEQRNLRLGAGKGDGARISAPHRPLEHITAAFAQQCRHEIVIDDRPTEEEERLYARIAEHELCDRRRDLSDTGIITLFQRAYLKK